DFGAKALQEQPAAEPLGAERPQPRLVGVAHRRVLGHAGANDALDLLSRIEPEVRRVDAELDAAGDDHVLAEEALDFARTENALLDRLRSEAQHVLDAMVACVLAQIAAAVPEDAREAARLADEKARIARPERIGVAVAVEHRCRHDVHHAVARIAHAADAPPRNELAVQADAD